MSGRNTKNVAAVKGEENGSERTRQCGPCASFTWLFFAPSFPMDLDFSVLHLRELCLFLPCTHFKAKRAGCNCPLKSFELRATGLWTRGSNSWRPKAAVAPNKTGNFRSSRVRGACEAPASLQGRYIVNAPSQPCQELEQKSSRCQLCPNQLQLACLLPNSTALDSCS